jgi:hypothetical protein
MPGAVLGGAAAMLLSSCGSSDKVQSKNPSDDSAEVSVGVTKAGLKTTDRTLEPSRELVPFQEIDVSAKESGFVKDSESITGRTRMRPGDRLGKNTSRLL